MTIRLWDVVTGNEILNLQTNTIYTTTVTFSPDGKTLLRGAVYDASIGRSDLIRIWELPSGRVLKTLAGHKEGITALRFSPDGKTLASSSGDGTILIGTGKNSSVNEIILEFIQYHRSITPCR